jgi:hypothetical protein
MALRVDLACHLFQYCPYTILRTLTLHSFRLFSLTAYFTFRNNENAHLYPRNGRPRGHGS